MSFRYMNLIGPFHVSFEFCASVRNAGLIPLQVSSAVKNPYGYLANSPHLLMNISCALSSSQYFFLSNDLSARWLRHHPIRKFRNNRGIQQQVPSIPQFPLFCKTSTTTNISA